MRSETLPLPRAQFRLANVSWPAEGLLIGALVLGATAMRLVRVSGVSGDLDEGIRGIQLLLISAGYRPVAEIYSSQGPLLLDMLYPLYRLFGETLAGARLAVGFYSVIGILGAYWLARLVSGPVGGATAALLLILSPNYLRNSRQALAEVPALAPAILSVGTAVAYQRTGRIGWLVLSGVLLGVALLVKPISVAAVVPVAIAAFLGSRRRFGPVFLVGAVAATVVLAIVVATGVPAVFNQMVEYRLRSRELAGWDLRENWRVLQTNLGRDQPGFFALALASGLVLVGARPWRSLPLLAWPVATLGLLLGYSPLFPKHAVMAVPPLAIVAGVGVGLVWRALRAGRWYGKLGRLCWPVLGLFIFGRCLRLVAGALALRISLP